MSFTVYTKYDPFIHHVYDLETLEDILYGLTDSEDEAKRIVSIAEHMKRCDCFATSGVMVARNMEDVE